MLPWCCLLGYALCVGIWARVTRQTRDSSAQSCCSCRCTNNKSQPHMICQSADNQSLTNLRFHGHSHHCDTNGRLLGHSHHCDANGRLLGHTPASGLAGKLQPGRPEQVLPKSMREIFPHILEDRLFFFGSLFFILRAPPYGRCYINLYLLHDSFHISSHLGVTE